MSSRTRFPKSWPDHGVSIAIGALLLSIMAHLAVIWWTSSLLAHPKVIWVQAERPLVLDAPRPQPMRSARETRKPRPEQMTPPTPPQPSTQVASPEPEAPLPPTDTGPNPNELAVVTQAPATDPVTPVTPEPAPGPLWLPGQAAQLPNSAQTLRYKVYGAVNNLTYQASSSLSYEPQPDSGYSVSYRVGAFLLGQRKQVSQGHMGAAGLEPRQFIDQSRRTQVTQVNVEQQTVKLPAQPNEQAWVAGTQDRLSVFVQLGAWVAAMPAAFDQGQSFQVPVWSSRETETWLVVSQGTEKTPTPYGEREAIRLTRMPLGPNDARVDMWFVPIWGALPVRIEMVEANGNRAEQTLNEIEPAPALKSP